MCSNKISCQLSVIGADWHSMNQCGIDTLSGFASSSVLLTSLTENFSHRV